MSELRKPKYVLLLKKQGNRASDKIELFESHLFPEGETWHRGQYVKVKEYYGQFRIRHNGKWWPKDRVIFVTKTRAKEMIFKNIEA